MRWASSLSELPLWCLYAASCLVPITTCGVSIWGPQPYARRARPCRRYGMTKLQGTRWRRVEALSDLRRLRVGSVQPANVLSRAPATPLVCSSGPYLSHGLLDPRVAAEPWPHYQHVEPLQPAADGVHAALDLVRVAAAPPLPPWQHALGEGIAATAWLLPASMSDYCGHQAW